ncbi:response regulator [Bdellovibrionota bacterium FG-1]
MNGCKVLVIDDEQLVRDGLGKLLVLDGYDVATAENGLSGLECFDRFAPCVVISDIKMPQMDGLEVLSKIQEKSPGTCVILMTGHGDTDLAIQALQLGAFDYFSKPVDYETLLLAIRRKQNGEAAARDRRRLRMQAFQFEKLASIGALAKKIEQLLPLKNIATCLSELAQAVGLMQAEIKELLIEMVPKALISPSQELRVSDAKILVVDDEPEIRDLLAEAISDKGHEVRTAVDGEDGLRVYEQFGPDLVISDLDMPKLMGLDMVRAIRGREGKTQADDKSPPDVIFLTGYGDPQSIVNALRLGGCDFVYKPMDFAKFQVCIERVLQRRAVRECLKAQSSESARHASMGTWAAGMVRELGDPLAVVMAHIERVRTVRPQGDEMIECLGVVAKIFGRIHRVVQQLLTCANPSEYAVLRDMDINEVIRSSFKKLDFLPSFVLASDLPRVRVDSGQLENVFVNLMSNSHDAFRTLLDPREKRVTISSTVQLQGQGGGHVVIVYEDNAGGMNAETVQKICDPFFTTKEVGTHTGLGMSVALGIVESHKGTIAIESELGKGSRFTLTFPVEQRSGGG